MAAKIKIKKDYDCYGTMFYRVEKNRAGGGIRRSELYEVMEKAGLFGHFVIDCNIPEDCPADELYDGPEWLDIYDPEQYFSSKALEEKYYQGYEDAIRDAKAIIESGGKL